MNEYRINPGVSTRTIQLTTGERVRFALKALDSAVQQAGSRFVPIGTEHLPYLPPRARVTRAEVITAPDGESDLVMYGQDLRFSRAAEMSLVPPSTYAPVPTEPLPGVTVAAEPRNYPADVWPDIVADAPLPVEEQAAWAGLPPLIWTIDIPIAWGAVKFAGAFFSRLGEEAADGLLAWINRALRSTKHPEREALIQIRFYFKDGGPAVLGFAPVDAHSDASVDGLRAAFDAAGLLAEFAGSVAAGQQPAQLRQCAFQWDADQWRLAWWATDDDVFITSWFNTNCPDPQRFLGSPLMEPETDGEASLSPPNTETQPDSS
ncbi:MAG TPA: hypothetical protein VGS19_01085 [Streptosporangiaceae bacterium]|nr:hypothetical protein [Streptosporangiaceae bacterium]